MRRRSLIPLALALCVLSPALAGCGTSSSSSTTGAGTTSSAGVTTSTPSTATSTSTTTSISSGPTIGYELVPLEHGPDLASASTTQSGPVDGITCMRNEQLFYHIHAHLAVFDGGLLYALPAGIGIPGSQSVNSAKYGPVAVGGRCYYSLHTHTTDGVIHIESPTKAIYTLGDFFDVWHQPLTPNSVGSLHGNITAFVNGKAWHESPRLIPLLPHEDIQVEIGEPIPPLLTVDWSKTGL